MELAALRRSSLTYTALPAPLRMSRALCRKSAQSMVLSTPPPVVNLADLVDVDVSRGRLHELEALLRVDYRLEAGERLDSLLVKGLERGEAVLW